MKNGRRIPLQILDTKSTDLTVTMKQAFKIIAAAFLLLIAIEGSSNRVSIANGNLRLNFVGISVL